MRLKVAAPADFASGAMFALIGLGALYWGADYDLGTLRRMGPGMLPTVLGSLLLAVGSVLAWSSLDRPGRAAELAPLQRVELPSLRTYRAVFFVLAALLAFALTVRPLGLFIATASLVLISSRAEPGAALLRSVVLAVVIAALCALIFVVGIGLPFRIWPRI